MVRNKNKRIPSEREKELQQLIKSCDKDIWNYEKFFKVGSFSAMIGGEMGRLWDKCLKAGWAKKDMEIELYELQGKELRPDLLSWKEKFWVNNKPYEKVSVN